MSEAYNPETKIYEELEALEIEARQFAQKRDNVKDPQDRKMYEQQLSEVEGRIAVLKKKLKR